jgi:hypothetical protein
MGGGHPLTVKGICYKKDLMKASKIFGTKNIFVIKSEDILDKDKKPIVLKKLLKFLQLDGHNTHVASMQWLNNQAASHYMINSGVMKLSKGVQTKINLNINSSVLKKGLYEASGYFPMLPETRQLIHHKWKKECRFLRINYGIEYANC